MTEKFQRIKEIVEDELNEAKDSAHDIDHIMRVYNLAMTLVKTEAPVDMDVVRAAVLLHDIGGAKEAADISGKTDHAVVGAEMAGPILKDFDFSDEQIKHVQACILSHRYRTNNKPETLEAKIVHDADKLDAVGAIGVARSFAWIGKYKAKIYKPAENLEAYAKENLIDGKMNGRIIDKSKHSIQINYETKDKYALENLYTDSAKKLGQERMIYFQEFLKRLEREVKGEL
jgi:uncharacterized protein